MGASESSVTIQMSCFCFRGEIVSQVLMRQSETFSKATGLVANKTKCKVYCGGVSKDTEKEILDRTGFGVATLPFRYLFTPD